MYAGRCFRGAGTSSGRHLSSRGGRAKKETEADERALAGATACLACVPGSYAQRTGVCTALLLSSPTLTNTLLFAQRTAVRTALPAACMTGLDPPITLRRVPRKSAHNPPTRSPPACRGLSVHSLPRGILLRLRRWRPPSAWERRRFLRIEGENRTLSVRISTSAAL